MINFSTPANIQWYIFRHGLATHSMTGYGDQLLTASLLPEGKSSVFKLAEYLRTIPTDVNFTSPIPRCVETAAIVSEVTAKKFVTDERLHEQLYTESSQEVTLRVSNFLESVAASSPRSVLICTHGAIIATLTHLLLEGQMRPEDILDFPPPSGLRMIVSGELHERTF